MAISDTIDSIKTNLASAYTKAQEKGATIPENKNIANLTSTIDSISAGGGDDEYVRPADWPEVPTMDGTKDEIYLLTAVRKNSPNFVAITVNGKCSIDWGDGHTESHTTSGYYNISHKYNYEDIPSSAWSEHSKGRMCFAHIQGDSGDFQLIRFDQPYDYPVDNVTTITLSADFTLNIHEIQANVSSCEVYFHTASKHTSLVECENIIWDGNVTNSSFNYNFNRMYNLVNVANFNFTNSIVLNQMCVNCYKLKYVTNFNAPLATTATSMFYNSRDLRVVEIKNLSSLTDATSMFSGCRELRKVNLKHLTSLTNATNMFNGCGNLEQVDLELDGNNTINMTQMFQNSYLSKINVNIDFSKANSFSEFLMYNYNMKETPIINAKNATSLYRTIKYCDSLQISKFCNTKNVTTMDNINDDNFAYEKNLFVMDASSIKDSSLYLRYYMLKQFLLYNYGAGSTGSMLLSYSTSSVMDMQDYMNHANMLKPNNEGYTRTFNIKSQIKNRLNSQYVRDTGERLTVKLATNDTSIIAGKTYYTYDEETDSYTEVIPDFSTKTLYFELVTADWNKYELCESTDTGAMTMADYFANVLKWTVT